MNTLKTTPNPALDDLAKVICEASGYPYAGVKWDTAEETIRNHYRRIAKQVQQFVEQGI